MKKKWVVIELGIILKLYHFATYIAIILISLLKSPLLGHTDVYECLFLLMNDACPCKSGTETYIFVKKKKEKFSRELQVSETRQVTTINYNY